MLVEELAEACELGDPKHVARVIGEEFDSERITDESQRMKVAQDFADNIMELIDVIAYDSIEAAKKYSDFSAEI